VNQQQTEDNFCKTFLARDLPEIVAFRKQQATQNTKNSLYRLVREALEEERPTKEIVMDIRDGMTKTNIQEHDAVTMVRFMYLNRFSWTALEGGREIFMILLGVRWSGFVRESSFSSNFVPGDTELYPHFGILNAFERKMFILRILLSIFIA
jgi:hypothetical protein